MPKRESQWISGILIISLVFIWELVWRCKILPLWIPGPTNILYQLWMDKADYIRHIEATLTGAALGFAIGNGIAVILVVGFRFIGILRLTMPVLTFLYSIPLILVVPILGIIFAPDTTKILTAALFVYYPTLLITSVALDTAPASLANVVIGAGGDEGTAFRKVRFRYGLDGLAVGLQAAAPFAILGSMLGEMAGARWGLGTYLLAIMVQAQPSKEWGVFFVCTIMAALAYICIGAILKPLRVPNGTATLGNQINGQFIAGARSQGSKLAMHLAIICLCLGIWQGVVRLFDLQFFVKGPIEIWQYAQGLPNEMWRNLGIAFMETLEWAGFGLAISLALAFMLSIVLDLLPSLVPAALPVALVSQSVPIIALIPLYVGIFGRGLWMTIAVVVSATFFPSFLTIYQGLQRTAQSLLDVARVSGASKLWILAKVKLPSALPFICGAARLAAPRILLGVTLAEYLATRRGLGALMFEARGTTDFGMICLIAFGSGTVSLAFYYFMREIEYFVSKKYKVETASVI